MAGRSIIDRALRVGEGRKLKEFEHAVSRINEIEPEMELLDDAELRTEADGLRERAGNGEPLDDMLPEAFALVREAGKRTLGQRHFDVQLIGGMVLHDGSIAEMKTGEGKTLTATSAVFLNSLGRQVRPPHHRQRLPRPPRRRVDGADLQRPRRERRGDPIDDAPGAAPPDVRRRGHLRHQLRVRVRLPARQHGVEPRGVRAARARLRDRGRGRQHPDRRGADAADHLRQAGAGSRHLLHVRPPRQADGSARRPSRS